MRYYPVFTNRALRSMEKYTLVEQSVLDVWYNGEDITFPNGGVGMVRHYPSYGFEIGLSCVRDEKTGEWLITGVWKRSRR